MKLTYRPHQRGPKLNDWVWVIGYIDFTLDQRELCRVIKGDHPNQVVLHGHWRGGTWLYTEVYLDLYPPMQKGRRKADYHLKKLPEDLYGNQAWEAKWISAPALRANSL